VDAMLGWAERRGSPATVVDPGAGSGRFVLAAAERFPEARLVAVEKDPLAALLLRANAQVRGVQDRLELIVADYREARIEASAGSTLFIGNPPYVRHHQIDRKSTGLNSSHVKISYAVFCLKKKNTHK